jgi:hypothetical protein
LIVALVVGAVGCGSTSSPPAATDYAATIEQWRADRDGRLRSDNGWLTLVGLHWLEPGDNPFGSRRDNAVVLPEDRAPDRAGSFVLEDGTVRVRVDEGVEVMLDGETVTERQLRTDADDPADVLELGSLMMHVIEREDRFGIRVKDTESDVLAHFSGMEYFPIDGAYRVDATFVSYDPPREVHIATVVGTVETMYAPGYAEFDLDGKTLTLEPMISGPDDEEYFFIFKDGTSGKETYGAGRYLYTPVASDGKVVLDFNKAYNPPCVFTPYATCPLPPPQNRLEIRIEAGEKDYGHS